MSAAATADHRKGAALLSHHNLDHEHLQPQSSSLCLTLSTMILPEEILAEVVSHVDGLDGLQISFTCRALYQLFQHLVIKQYLRIIYLQICEGRIQGHGDRWHLEKVIEPLFQHGGAEAEPNNSFNAAARGPTELRLKIVDLATSWAVWTFQSLLVRAKTLGRPVGRLEVVARHSLSLPANAPETAAWHRAMKRLCETSLELENVTFDVSGASTRRPPGTSSSPTRWEPSPNLVSGLTSFILRSPIHNAPPYFGDLDRIVEISSNSLTSLTLYPISRSTDEWATAFPKWSLRQLTSLQIYRGETLPLDALALFLVRHTMLRTAVLAVESAEMANTAVPQVAQDLSLSESLLHELTCKPPVIEFFLRSSISFPHLTSLKLDHTPPSASKKGSNSHNFSQLTSILGLLGCDGVAPNLRTLHLDLAYSNDIQSWLGSATLKPSGKALHLVRRVTNWARRGRGVDSPNSAPPTSEPASFQNLAMALASLTQVEVLHLSIERKQTVYHGLMFRSPPERHIEPRMVTDFLSAFPSLKSVTLAKGFLKTSPWPSGTGAVLGAVFKWSDVAAAWKVCSNLEVMKIVGVAREPVVWKRGEEEPTIAFS